MKTLAQDIWAGGWESLDLNQVCRMWDLARHSTLRNRDLMTATECVLEEGRSMPAFPVPGCARCRDEAMASQVAFPQGLTVSHKGQDRGGTVS